MDFSRVAWRVFKTGEKATFCRTWNDRCKGKPSGQVTLCPVHLSKEFARCAREYRKGYDTATAYKELLDILRAEMLEQNIQQTPQSLGDLMKLLGETGDTPSPPELDSATEEMLPAPPRKGRPPMERDSDGSREYQRRRAGGGYASRRDLPQWPGDIKDPEAEYEEIRALSKRMDEFDKRDAEKTAEMRRALNEDQSTPGEGHNAG